MNVTYHYSTNDPIISHDRIDPPEHELASFEGEDDQNEFDYETDGDDATDLAEFMTSKPSKEYIKAISDAIYQGVIDIHTLLSCDDEFKDFIKGRYYDKAYIKAKEEAK